MGPSRKTSTTDFPWWLVVLVLAGIYAVTQTLTSEIHAQILAVLSHGIGITLMVTAVAFAGASALGLLLALGGLSRFLFIRQAVKLYIEVIRGIPIIVLLLYVAFVGVPLAVEGFNAVTGFFGIEPMKTRDVSLLWRAVIALILAYSAFLAEVFRAGIIAVDAGQIEAAKALGLNGWLRFRLIIAPQAFRTILPPYGNDFIAMVKDSSLVSVLGVTDVTQLGKITAVSNFRYFETYNLVALIYLTLTVTLSLALTRLERHLNRRQP